jgi:thioredoxin reductase
VAEVKAKDNIEIILNSEIKKIAGTNKVEKVIISNVLSGETREVNVDGVFIEVGRIASTDLVADFVERDAKSQIVASDKMETKTPGLFVAGDVAVGEFKQITIAIGQATIAALSAYQYLQLKAGKKTIARDY